MLFPLFQVRRLIPAFGLILFSSSLAFAARHPVPREHPRLFGSLERLRALAAERPEVFVRMDEVALERQGGEMEYLFSAALASAVTGDKALARDAVAQALKIVRGAIRVGHETFGKDLANCAVVFDLCRSAWTEAEVAEFISFMNRTLDANKDSELTVFHNGFYSCPTDRGTFLRAVPGRTTPLISFSSAETASLPISTWTSGISSSGKGGNSRGMAGNSTVLPRTTK